MRTILLIGFVGLILFSGSGVFAEEQDFDIGLTYYLLNDTQSAKPFFNRFFVDSNNQRVADAYAELFKNNQWDAAERFKRYLEMNHRSMIAIVGMALSTRLLLDSTSMMTLERALRIHPNSPAVTVALGFEYFNKRNYPKAEEYFARALNYSKNDVFKLPLAYLFLEMNEFTEVLAMVEKNAIADRRNFHFNFLAAKAHYLLNDWNGVGQYIQNAISSNPQHVGSRLLWAQFLVRQNRAAEARDALQGMHFESYNNEFEKTMAQVLFALKDRQAYNKMLEVLIQQPWDKDINRMLGVYHLREAKGVNIQNWINRSLIAGNSEADLKALFPAKYQIVAPFELPFFSVKAMAWFNDQYLIVGAKKNSGDKDMVYVLDTKTQKIVSTSSVLGDILHIHVSAGLSDWAIINTIGTENQSTNLYSLSFKGNRFACKSIQSSAFKMPDILSGFAADGLSFYFVSSLLADALYQAPFTVFDANNQRRPLFPNFPLSVYEIDKKTEKPTLLKTTNQIGRLPIKHLRDYDLLSQAFQQDEGVRSVITQGFSIDLAASRTVKAYCNPDSNGAIVFATDVEAKRGFDAHLFSLRSGRSLRINESDFLGVGNYAEINIHAFNPDKMEIIVGTANEQKQIIQFNAQSKLTRRLADKVLDAYYYSPSKSLYYLVEKKQNLFEKETQLFRVNFDPFSKTKFKDRQDIIEIQKDGMGSPTVQFCTFNGEILALDGEDEFTYLRPGLNSIILAVSPGGKRSAFVNGRIITGI